MPVDRKPVDSPSFWRARLKLALHERKPHNAVYRSLTEQDYTSMQDTHAAMMRDRLTDQMCILDAGCGIGELYKIIPFKQLYVGVDISPDMIAYAKEQFPEADFRVCDLRDLSQFQDKEFDVVIARGIQGTITENLGREYWDTIFMELVRVSKAVWLMAQLSPTDTEWIECPV